MAPQFLPEPHKAGARVIPEQSRYRTFAGTIIKGMQVLDAQDRCIGEVERVENDHIMLVPSGDGCEYFVPLAIIDGIHAGQVLLAGRSDSTFGLGAQP